MELSKKKLKEISDAFEGSADEQAEDGWEAIL